MTEERKLMEEGKEGKTSTHRTLTLISRNGDVAELRINPPLEYTYISNSRGRERNRRLTMLRIYIKDLYRICPDLTPDQKISKREEYAIDAKKFGEFVKEKVGYEREATSEKNVNEEIDEALFGGTGIGSGLTETLESED